MAGEIYHMAEDYVAKNAPSYDGKPEEEAVARLAKDCRQHLLDEGWNAKDYGVDLEQIARDGLAKRRNS